MLIADPADPLANSYLSVARADEIFAARLYTTDWDAAASTPDAEDWFVDGDHSAADTTVNIASGTGAFTVGTKIRFDDLPQVYSVTVVGVDQLTISPALVDALVDGDAVVRITGSTKEKALIWASALLDTVMEWQGTPTTAEQAMRWPRYGVYSRDGYLLDQDTITLDLELAVADLALALLARDRVSTPSLLGQGIEEATVGPLRVKVSSAQVDEIIPQSVLAMLAHLGALAPTATMGSSHVVRLERA